MPEDAVDPEAQEIAVPDPPADIQPEGKEVVIVPEAGGEKAKESPAKDTLDPAKLTKLESRLEALELEKKAWQNKTQYERRQRQDLEKEIANLRTSLPKTHVPPEKEPNRTELDQLVEDGKWDVAVEKLADKKVTERINALQQKAVQDRQQADRLVSFQQAQSEAVYKYPDLANDDSELTEFYLKVLDKFPQYRNDPNGPMLTMYRMEEEAKRLGVQLTPSEEWSSAYKGTPAVGGNKEVARRARAQAGSIGAGRGAAGSRTYTLSKEQQEIVRNSGLDEKSYARVASQLEGNGNGGVEA